MRIPFREKDEMKSFQAIFNFYKENYPKMIEIMINSMDEKTKKDLHNILNARMIDSQHAIARRIVKPLAKKNV